MTAYRPYTIPEIRRVVKLRMAGWHPVEIADIMERSQSAINRLLSIERQKHGHTYPKIRMGLKWTPERIERMARDYPIKSYSKLGEENGISSTRVFYLMAKRAEALQQGGWI